MPRGGRTFDGRPCGERRPADGLHPAAVAAARSGPAAAAGAHSVAARAAAGRGIAAAAGIAAAVAAAVDARRERCSADAAVDRRKSNRTGPRHRAETRHSKRTARRRSDEPGSTPSDRNDRHPGPELSTLARPAIIASLRLTCRMRRRKGDPRYSGPATRPRVAARLPIAPPPCICAGTRAPQRRRIKGGLFDAVRHRP